MFYEAYENSRKIVNDVEPTSEYLIGLKNGINCLVNYLPKHKIEIEEWDAVLIPILVRKMDGESCEQITKLRQLIEFIQKRSGGMYASYVVQFLGPIGIKTQLSKHRNGQQAI